jgi:hypothetical protein
MPVADIVWSVFENLRPLCNWWTECVRKLISLNQIGIYLRFTLTFLSMFWTRGCSVGTARDVPRNYGLCCNL